MTAVVWGLIAVQVLATAACGLGLRWRDTAGLPCSLRRIALALLAAGILPVPALLAVQAPAAAWALWGAATIAAAVLYAAADTLRDDSRAPTRPRSGP